VRPSSARGRTLRASAGDFTVAHGGAPSRNPAHRMATLGRAPSAGGTMRSHTHKAQARSALLVSRARRMLHTCLCALWRQRSPPSGRCSLSGICHSVISRGAGREMIEETLSQMRHVRRRAKALPRRSAASKGAGAPHFVWASESTGDALGLGKVNRRAAAHKKPKGDPRFRESPLVIASAGGRRAVTQKSPPPMPPCE
jgi:hypothetical protein